MKIQINKSKDFKCALDIARKNSHFFNQEGMASMKKDFITDIFIGAYSDKKMVGFISFKEINNNVIEINWIAVDPQFQNKGIGSRLLNDGLKLISNKYKICEVKTLSEINLDPQYAKTRNFYKKLGFIALETIDPYPGWEKGNPCQIFIKVL